MLVKGHVAPTRGEAAWASWDLPVIEAAGVPDRGEAGATPEAASSLAGQARSAPAATGVCRSRVGGAADIPAPLQPRERRKRRRRAGSPARSLPVEP